MTGIGALRWRHRRTCVSLGWRTTQPAHHIRTLEQGAETPNTIPVFEVEQKLDDIRDGLKRDALPLDMEHIDPPQEELDTLDEMRFVRQLQSVGIGGTRLQYAKRDFYRASAQRSQWARQNLLFDGEVGRFERTLIEEWQPRFAQMCHALAEGCEEAAVREAGHKLYGWVETDARFPLRTTVSRFLNVGSYQSWPMISA